MMEKLIPVLSCSESVCLSVLPRLMEKPIPMSSILVRMFGCLSLPVSKHIPVYSFLVRIIGFLSVCFTKIDERTHFCLLFWWECLDVCLCLYPSSFQCILFRRKLSDICLSVYLSRQQCRIPLKAKKAIALGPAPQGAPRGPLDPWNIFCYEETIFIK